MSERAPRGAAGRYGGRVKARTTTWTLIGVAAAAAGTAAFLVVRARRPGQAALGPSGVVESNSTPRRGSPKDRGRTAAYALDVDRLRARDELEPVVQYLTFIQSQRGEESHLLFIRYEDIDAMAALEGNSVPTFLERLDQLGVVVSNN